jgi:hypothetical protein
VEVGAHFEHLQQWDATLNLNRSRDLEMLKINRFQEKARYIPLDPLSNTAMSYEKRRQRFQDIVYK